MFMLLSHNNAHEMHVDIFVYVISFFYFFCTRFIQQRHLQSSKTTKNYIKKVFLFIITIFCFTIAPCYSIILLLLFTRTLKIM